MPEDPGILFAEIIEDLQSAIEELTTMHEELDKELQ